MTIAALVLAAGRGRRMGADKMRLEWQGHTLPVWPVMAAKAAGLDPIIAILAPDHDDLAAILSPLGAQVIVNPDPDAGMSGSLRAGIAALPPDVDAVAVLLGDMPLVTAETLHNLAAALAPDHGITIAIPSHQGRRGNPVMFHRHHFAELTTLTGDTGARDLLKRYGMSSRLVEAGPEIHADMDTPADLGITQG